MSIARAIAHIRNERRRRGSRPAFPDAGEQKFTDRFTVELEAALYYRG